MNIRILGTGMIGHALGTKLVQGGNLVTLGSRTANNQTAQKWASPSRCLPGVVRFPRGLPAKRS